MTEGWVGETFLNAVAAWNLYGLPALLLLTAAIGWRRGSPSRTVRRLGLFHLGLAAWSATRALDESLAYRVMGIFPSNPITGLFGSLLAVACDLPVGIGLLRLSRRARWPAAALALFRMILAILVARWAWVHGAAVDPTEWPRHALTYLGPLVGLAVLTAPGTAGAFRGDDRPSGRWGGAVGLASLLAVAILGSVVATDALDLGLRAAADTALAE